MAATALEGLVRGLAVDLAPVRVKLVSAGPVKTDMLLKALPEEYVKMYEEETLTKQLGKVEHVAEAYLYIIKDGGVTGSILATDSGRRIA
ncbi:Short-chain dehydrogenase/reductase malC [Pseudocercospora fuligena]|uniref:Short-chain dehydrogenase/reductase malC n=1 Tax=Pseudocercospora fuligena TaxID=685502 RepID=A0A8H6RS96_9PEZI|nr:Short-chain dehydrogenase/reductase malC [Pseudocercospora fuligena]